LITSCKDCNRGKRDIPLDENSILEKQRKQLEDIQERKEQLEMLFDWKKNCDNFDNYSTNLLSEYIESKISPYTLNETGKANISKLLKKFDLEELFKAIDKSEEVYLRYDKENLLTPESVENFMNKIGGIATNNKKSPVDQKIGYIRGICRNRFNYWNDTTGMSILKEYINALKNSGWDENLILKDLDEEVIRISKESRNWSEWRNILEGWIDDITNWDCNKKIDVYEMSVEEIELISEHINTEILDFFQLINFVIQPFENIAEKDIIKEFQVFFRKYLEEQINILKTNPEQIDNFKLSYENIKKYNILSYFENRNEVVKKQVVSMFSTYLIKFVNDNLFLPNLSIHTEKDANILYDKIFKDKSNIQWWNM